MVLCYVLYTTNTYSIIDEVLIKSLYLIHLFFEPLLKQLLRNLVLHFQAFEEKKLNKFENVLIDIINKLKITLCLEIADIKYLVKILSSYEVLLVENQLSVNFLGFLLISVGFSNNF